MNARFIAQLLAFVLVAATSIYAVNRVDSNQKNTEKEALARTDQVCRLFEQSHLDDVIQLRQTYKYIVALSPEERKSTINQFIIRQLPTTEKTARTDRAPAFCDEPNVGLPEPDPVVPKRPQAVDELLK